MGAQMVKEVAQKTNEDAGDGTTTATVLAQALSTEKVQNLLLLVTTQWILKKGIDLAVTKMTEELRR